jgi:hypothetical protein
VVGVVVAASLVVGACAQKQEPLGPTATVPQATTTTNPFAVPSVIDEAYVNRVLAGLDEVKGDAVRLAVSAATITPEAMERLTAIYASDKFLQLSIDLLNGDLTPQRLENFGPTPGDSISTVTGLISVSDSCIFAAIDRDYSHVTAASVGGTRNQWIALQRASSTPNRVNPTGWAYLYDGFEPGRNQPEDPCANL